MSKELAFAIQIDKPNRARNFAVLAKQIKGINVLQWLDNQADKGPIAA